MARKLTDNHTRGLLALKRARFVECLQADIELMMADMETGELSAADWLRNYVRKLGGDGSPAVLAVTVPMLTPETVEAFEDMVRTALAVHGRRGN